MLANAAIAAHVRASGVTAHVPLVGQALTFARSVCAFRVARVLVRRARKTAQAYFQMYKEHIPVAQLVRETAAVMQEFTRGWGLGLAERAIVPWCAVPSQARFWLDRTHHPSHPCAHA